MGSLHHFHIPEDFILDHRFINYCFKNNEQDELYWENWIREHPDKEEVVKEARYLVHTMSVRVPSEEKQKEWKKVRPKKFSYKKKQSIPAQEFRSKRKFAFLGVAAVLLLFVAGLWFWNSNNKGEDKIRNTSSNPSLVTAFETHYGEQHKVVLKDGTKVWLNADSKLTYVSDFKTDDKREVSLSGEAYFEVSQKAHQPFIVHTKGMNIIVLGTSFNVKAYPKEQAFETTLVDGSVKVQLNADPSKEIRLKPEEKITVFNDLKKHPVHKISDSLLSKASIPKFSVSEVYKDPHLDGKILETVWRQGKLAFKNERFESLALQLNHRYGVTLHFEDKALKNYKYTGIFTKESLEEALKALQLTSPSHPFQYRIQNKTVYISIPKKNQ